MGRVACTIRNSSVALKRWLLVKPKLVSTVKYIYVYVCVLLVLIFSPMKLSFFLNICGFQSYKVKVFSFTSRCFGAPLRWTYEWSFANSFKLKKRKKKTNKQVTFIECPTAINSQLKPCKVLLWKFYNARACKTLPHASTSL